jgi:hypothetical protein
MSRPVVINLCRYTIVSTVLNRAHWLIVLVGSIGGCTLGMVVQVDRLLLT